MMTANYTLVDAENGRLRQIHLTHPARRVPRSDQRLHPHPTWPGAEAGIQGRPLELDREI